MSNDLYDILLCNKTSSTTEIKNNYYKLSRLYHPDKIHDIELKNIGNNVTVQIQSAYSILSHPFKRLAYDYYGHKGVSIVDKYIQQQALFSKELVSYEDMLLTRLDQCRKILTLIKEELDNDLDHFALHVNYQNMPFLDLREYKKGKVSFYMNYMNQVSARMYFPNLGDQMLSSFKVGNSFKGKKSSITILHTLELKYWPGIKAYLNSDIIKKNFNFIISKEFKYFDTIFNAKLTKNIFNLLDYNLEYTISQNYGNYVAKTTFDTGAHPLEINKATVSLAKEKLKIGSLELEPSIKMATSSESVSIGVELSTKNSNYPNYNLNVDFETDYEDEFKLMLSTKTELLVYKNQSISYIFTSQGSEFFQTIEYNTKYISIKLPFLFFSGNDKLDMAISVTYSLVLNLILYRNFKYFQDLSKKYLFMPNLLEDRVEFDKLTVLQYNAQVQKKYSEQEIYQNTLDNYMKSEYYKNFRIYVVLIGNKEAIEFYIENNKHYQLKIGFENIYSNNSILNVEKYKLEVFDITLYAWTYVENGMFISKLGNLSMAHPGLMPPNLEQNEEASYWVYTEYFKDGLVYKKWFDSWAKVEMK